MEQQHITYLGSVPYMPMRQPQMEAYKYRELGEILQDNVKALGGSLDQYAKYKEQEGKIQDIKSGLDFENQANDIIGSYRMKCAAEPMAYDKHRQWAQSTMNDIGKLNYSFSDDLSQAKFDSRKRGLITDFNVSNETRISQSRLGDAEQVWKSSIERAMKEGRYTDAKGILQSGANTFAPAGLVENEIAGVDREERILRDPDGLLRDYYSGAVHLSPSDFNRCVGNSNSQGDSMADDAITGKQKSTEADVDALIKQGYLPNALEARVAKAKARGTFDMEKPDFLSECLKDIDTLPIVDPDSKEGTGEALTFKTYWKDKIGLDDSEVNSVLNVWKTKAKSKNESIDFSGMKSALVGMGALNGTQYTVNLNAPDTKLLDGGNYSVKGTWNAKSVSDTDGKIKDKSLWTSEEKAKYEQLEASAKLDADNNWFSVVQKWNGWRASEGANANKVEQLNMFKKYIEDVTQKRVPLDISTMDSEADADNKRKRDADTKAQSLAREAIRTGKRYQPADWGAADTYAQKYPVIGISQDNQDDVLVLGRNELQDIPQLTQFMDEAGNIKPDKLKEAQALFDKMCCDISIGSGRKRKDYQIGRIVLSNSGGGINVGVGTAVKMKMNRNGLRNAEIRFRFDGKYKEEAEEATQVSDAGESVDEEGLLPQK